MTLKVRQTLLAEQLEDGVSLNLTEPATNVVASATRSIMPRRVVYTLTSFVLNLEADDDYIGAKVADLPDSNILILGSELSLEAVKGEVTNGLEAATDINIGVGTAAASNSTLSGDMQNILNVTAYTATDASPALAQHSADNGTDLVSRAADGAASALYLNLAASVTADDTLTCTGTITLYYIDLGNVAS